jgi:hypothetical protein
VTGWSDLAESLELMMYRQLSKIARRFRRADRLSFLHGARWGAL